MVRASTIAALLSAIVMTAACSLAAAPAPHRGDSSSTQSKCGTCMDTFDAMITAMEQHAKALGVKGVIVVASMDSTGFSWMSRMKAVDATKVLDDHPQTSKYPGYNFIGIAYSKAAEMADTKLNSGSNIRVPYQGEFGYQGGVIEKTSSGYLLAVFSGGTSEQDLEIAKVGMSAIKQQ